MAQKISERRKKLLRARAKKSRRPIEPIHPDLLAASWSKKLQNEVERGFKLIKERLFPVLKKDVKSLGDNVRTDIDDDADIIGEVLNGILKRYFGGMSSKEQPNLAKYAALAGRKLVQPMQKQVDSQHKTQFSRTFKRISGVDPLKFEPELSGFLEVAGDQNVNKIVSLNSSYFDSVREMSNQALRKGTSFSELADDITALTDTTKSRAKLIATDQVQKLNADLESRRQQNNHVTRYIWRTRRNARVRKEHADLEGAVFDWKFPPVTVLTGKRSGERNHPGQDINCKCWAEPVLEDLTGKKSRTLEAAELKTRKLIAEGRVPGYELPPETVESKPILTEQEIEEQYIGDLGNLSKKELAKVIREKDGIVPEAITDYVKGSSGLNFPLRTGQFQELSKEEKRQIVKLDKILNVKELKADVQLNRGLHFKTKEKFDDARNNFNIIGGIHKEDAYMSSSIDDIPDEFLATSENPFSIRLKILANKNTKGVHIPGYTKDPEEEFIYEERILKENEFLLPRGTIYEIIDKKKFEKHANITIRIIND